MKFDVNMAPLWNAFIPLFVMALIGALICVPLRRFLPKPLLLMLVGVVEVGVLVIWSLTFFRNAFV